MTRAASFVCHQMKSTDGHMDTNTELSGNCKYFLAQKNWKEWKKCGDTEWKKEDKGFFCFCTDELRYKIQNSGNFFFLIDHIILNGHTTFVFRLSISLCAFGVYIFVPFCIDRTCHILYLAMMSHLEKHSLLIVFAFISSCIIVLCG